MSSPNDQRFFLELNESFLVAARVSVKSSPLVLEEVGEAKLDSSDAVGETLNTVFGSRDAAKAAVCCLLRPSSRALHLATADQARQHKTKEALSTFAKTLLTGESGPVEVAAAQARSGLPIDGNPDQRWLLSAAPRSGIDALLGKLDEWKLTATRVESATMALVDAAQLALNAGTAKPILMWEIAEASSHLLLVGSGGVFGVRKLGFGFDKVVEAVMAELNLKFKGSAAKLFFNDLYDFSETGPKIAVRVASDLQSEVAALGTEAGVAADVFFCSGLPPKQGWLGKCLADALKLTAWEKKALDWCESGGISGIGKVDAAMAPVCAGLLATASARHVRAASAPVAWHPAWPGGSEPEVVPAPKPAAPAAAAPTKKEVPAAVPAKQIATPSAKPAPAPAKNESKPAAKPASAPAAKTEAKPASAAAKSAPAKPAPAPKATSATADTPASSKKGPPMGLIIGGLAAVIALGGGFFYMQSASAKKAEQERAALEQKLQAEREAERLALEEKLKAEEEARAQAEAKAKAEAEARALAQQQAEAEARLHEQETNRLLNSRGGVKIVTEPAGATIEIGNLAPQVSPATFQQMRLGKYTAKISLAGYDPRSVEFEVQENKVTDPGMIKLVRQVGVIDVAVKPAGVRYTIRPAGIRFNVSADETFEGVSPATIKSVPVGSYLVTLMREGWPDYSEEVEVAKNGTVTLDKDLSGTVVHIRSTPSGARVVSAGVELGVTPLTLNDAVPGTVAYTLDLTDYYPVALNSELEMNKVLDLSAELEPVPFIADSSQLDSRPEPMRMVQPNVEGISVREAVVVRVTLVVDYLGHTRNCQLEESIDPILRERVLEAMAQWRFRPATAGGRPVSTRMATSVMINRTR